MIYAKAPFSYAFDSTLPVKENLLRCMEKADRMHFWLQNLLVGGLRFLRTESKDGRVPLTDLSMDTLNLSTARRD